VHVCQGKRKTGIEHATFVQMIRASARYEEATKDSVWTATHLIKTHVMLADSITQEEV
jgi:hypothetical protein